MIRFLIAFALCAASALAADTPAARLGVNPAGVNDWCRDFLYADALKHARPFATGYGQPGAAPVPVDDAGWPKADCTVLASTVAGDSAGRYAVEFTGSVPPDYDPAVKNLASVAFFSTDARVASRAYDPATNRTTLLIDVGPDGSGLWLILRGTRRLPTDPPGTGFTNLTIRRPLAPGSAECHDPGELFYRPLIANLRAAGVTVVRNLDWSGANQTHADSTPDGPDPAVRWATRHRPSDPSQSNWADPGAVGKGVAVEHQIALCNAIGADLWACWPDTADAEYRRKFCLACRYGTDGAEPYTSDQDKPAWPPLKGKLIVEESNETWNDGTFAQGRRIMAASQAWLKAHPGDLDWDGPADQYAVRARYVAKLAADNQLIADAVWPGGLRSRYDVVLCGQQANPEWTVGQGLAYLKARGAKPVEESVSLAGCGWYRQPVVGDPSAGVAAVVAGGLDDPSAWIGTVSKLLAPYPRIRQACYEGGAYFGPGDHATTATEAVQADPAFGVLVRRAVDDQRAAGASILNVYGTSQPPWGLWPTPARPGVKLAATRAAFAGPDIPAPADTVQTRIDAAVAAHAQADASAKALIEAQRKAKDDADAAVKADAAVRDGLKAAGKPAIGRAADGSPVILTPTDAGYRADPAVDATAPIILPKAA